VPDIFDEFLDELKRRQGAGAKPESEEPGEPPEPSSDEGPAEPTPVRARRTPRASSSGAPPRRGRSTPSGGGGRRRRWRIGAGWIVAGIAVVAFLLLTVGVGFWTDLLWYRSVGYESVLWIRVGATTGLFALGLVLGLVVLLGNLFLADRLAPPADPSAAAGLGDFLERLNRASSQEYPGFPGRQGPRPVIVGPELPDPTPLARLVIAGISVFAALLFGAALAASWETVLLWLHRVPFGATDGAVVDPVFGRDIGWFLFELPFLRAVQSIFNALVVGALLAAGARYLVGMARSGLRFPTPVRVHLGILGGLVLLSIAFGYQLDKFELVYSTRMPVDAVGVSYTDANAQFPAYDLLTVLSALAAAFLVGAAFTRWRWPLVLTIGGWLLASLLVGTVYPELVQRFVVQPNQLAEEQTYLDNNIAMTRLAYGLNTWNETNYGGEAPLTAAQISQESATFQNARLWDYRPLGDTIDQLQTLRRYYDFVDVDTDRYMINGQLRQVMLSARELDLAGNPTATGWVNQRITYTHGIGVAMAPVNEVTSEGQPVLFIKNLPPVSSPGAPEVTQPRIYFGEAKTGYVVVDARQPEFDYPSQAASGGSEQAVETSWTGTTGIPLSTTFDRLLFALRFGDLDLLISDQVTSQSQLLMHRDLATRLQLLAPFLRYDKDPYVVIDGQGHLQYIQDAYTVSDRFPEAQWFDTSSLPSTGLGGDSINYIRNSVKVVMDAYDGSMRFYVADPNDPIIRAYEGIFPGLFQPMSALPSDLVPHLRYPEELFNVQTREFGRYHVTDASTLYSSNDIWTVPTGSGSEQSLPPEAYYVVMRMPGEPNPEFLLLQPMVPLNRPNMIAWVAARSDQPNYGTVRYFQFPADSNVLGPSQIEARISNDPTISAQITLWNTSGSTVVRGNLIVVPVGDSLLYLQPIYLKSSQADLGFPEFRRIVVASPSSVVWAPTLGEALQQLLAVNGQPGPSPGPTATPSPAGSASPTPTSGPSPSGLPTDVAGLIAYANAHFEAAQAALRNGDFASYGQEMALVEQALSQLQQLAPTASP
jgi:uncharacterized protein